MYESPQEIQKDPLPLEFADNAKVLHAEKDRICSLDAFDLETFEAVIPCPETREKLRLVLTKNGGVIIFVCKSGKRSREVVQNLLETFEQYPDATERCVMIGTIQGGRDAIVKWITAQNCLEQSS